MLAIRRDDDRAQFLQGRLDQAYENPLAIKRRHWPGIVQRKDKRRCLLFDVTSRDGYRVTLIAPLIDLLVYAGLSG